MTLQWASLEIRANLRRWNLPSNDGSPSPQESKVWKFNVEKPHMISINMKELWAEKQTGLR